MWIETVLLIEAAAGLCLSSMNLVLLMQMGRLAKRRPRRVAVQALACVCAAQAMEALLFLAQEGPSSAEGAWASAALVLVRSLLTGSAALISILLWRAAPHR